MAASAYLSCSRLYNDYDGIQHDYTKKQGLVWQEVFLPEYAPQEWKDREQLWNAVEEVETAKDSRLAREFVVALPIELSREEQIELLQEFIREQFVSDGMCADAAIHDTDGHNPHAHILLTVRPLDEQGKWQYKTEKEYLCMKNGEERGFTAAEFRAAQQVDQLAARLERCGVFTRKKAVQFIARRHADRGCAVDLCLHCFVLFTHLFAAFRRIQANSNTDRHQTFICVILPQKQAVFRA